MYKYAANRQNEALT